MHENKRSQELFEEAKRFIPGGVNSPVRAFKSVGGEPIFVERGKGAKVYDVDGNEYIDYVGSWGPLILCYHGHGDSFLIQAGSGVATLGIPGSPGVPEALARETISLPFNRSDVLEDALRKRRDEIAAVILEPVMGNMGVIPPREGFLEGVRALTRDHEVLLIFDEVITGFRVALGGAQERYGILPDLTCLGKIIGGGLPVGAYGGRKELMDHIAPDGPVYQAGTLSGNPLAMTAGYEALRVLQEPGTYQRLETMAKKLSDGFAENARQAGVHMALNRVGSMMSGFFVEGEVWDADDARRADAERFVTYFWAMLERGISIAPSPFEAMFVSLAHSEEDIEHTLDVHLEVLQAM